MAQNGSKYVSCLIFVYIILKTDFTTVKKESL